MAGEEVLFSVYDTRPLRRLTLCLAFDVHYGLLEALDNFLSNTLHQFADVDLNRAIREIVAQSLRTSRRLERLSMELACTVSLTSM